MSHASTALYHNVSDGKIRILEKIENPPRAWLTGDALSQRFHQADGHRDIDVKSLDMS
jgi:hypothetical protein